MNELEISRREFEATINHYMKRYHLKLEDLLNPESSGCETLKKEFEDYSEEEKRLFLLLVNHNLEIQRRSRQFCINDRQHTIYSGERFVYFIDPSPYAAWGHYVGVLREGNFSDEAISSIQSSSKNILEHLSLKTEVGKPIRGAVIGNVQSGKTANMAGLMAMAADNGWNMFVVLTGTIDNLRKQTETRMIHDLRDNINERYHWVPIPNTSKKEFKKIISFDLSSESTERYIAVCLKEKNWLEKLIDGLHTAGNNLGNMRLMVIDDEADQASVDTLNKPNSEGIREERSKINALIYNLVYNLDKKGNKTEFSFGCVNYISYTATPYAVLLNEGPGGLYPANFIFMLTASNEYFGPKRIFGYDDSPGMDIIVEDDTINTQIKNIKSGSSWIPDSLKDCIAWFICCAAIFRYRKINKPVSLLINPSHIQDFHSLVDEAIRGYLNEEKNDLLKRSKVIYSEQTRRFSLESFNEAVIDYPLNVQDYPSYSEILPFVKELLSLKVSRITLDEEDKDVHHYSDSLYVCVDNSDNNVDKLGNQHSTNRLLYPQEGDIYSPNVSYPFIVIGGNTLSRGLTISGLVASYFLRDVSQVDTLMQMGRWFGYRRGYELLPRIWMSHGTRISFEIMTAIDEDLKQTIQEYHDDHMTPADVPVRIRTVPSFTAYLNEKIALKKITSGSKMTGAVTTNLTFANKDIEIHRYYNDKSLTDNIILTKDFLTSIVQTSDVIDHKDNNYVIRNVPFDVVLQYLNSFKHVPEPSFHGIDRCLSWLGDIPPSKVDYVNVIVAGVEKSGSVKQFTFGTDEEMAVGMVSRNSSSKDSSEIKIKTVRSKSDLVSEYDLSGLDDERLRALYNASVSERTKCRREQGLSKVLTLMIYCVERKGEGYLYNDDVIALSVSVPDGMDYRDDKTDVQYYKLYIEKRRNEDAELKEVSEGGLVEVKDL